MFYKWGTKEKGAAFDTLAKARIVIQAAISDYLANNSESVVNGSDGSAYDIDIRVVLVKK